jgi:WavE lipopolysaccharide synthesis
MNEKIDIVIQGKYNEYTDEIINSYLKISFVNKIIVSCWEDNKQPEYFGEKVIFVRNKYPESPGTDNRNLQILSSLNGLKECEENFAVKTRSDQKFSYESMIKMYDFFLKNKEKNLSYKYENLRPKGKILVAGVYPNLLFCPRDHIFWGYTEDLIDLFNIPLEKYGLIDKLYIPKERLWMYYEYFIRTETYIGSHYCSKFDDIVNRLIIKEEEHLYDNAIYWYYSKEISNNLTFNVFKSFPKTAVDFEWPIKINFNMESYHESCSWDEEGF